MGATTFTTTATASNATDAFRIAVANAKAYRWDDDGDDGYSGDISTKRDYYIVNVPEGKTPNEIINKELNHPSPRCEKWSSLAGCIDNGDGSFTFFGWAPC